MKVISVINYKGGVGKTSLTANLAAELAWRGRKVLLIDLDAQASLTFSFIKPDEWTKTHEAGGTIKAWFDSHDTGNPLPLADLINTPLRISQRISKPGKLDIIYSHLGLINVDLELATKLAGANLTQAKRNFLSVHRRLADGIKPIALSGEYDLILIDCPPNFNIVTKTAIVASDGILVPTRPDELSTLGIDYLARSIESLVNEHNEYATLGQGDQSPEISPAMIGIVFSMIQEYAGGPMSAQRTYIARVKAKSVAPVFDAYIKRNDTLFADSPQYGVPVVLTGHANQSHQSVVKGLEAVATEFIQRTGI